MKIRDAFTARFLKVGDKVQLPAGGMRTVTRTVPAEQVVWFDGAHLELEMAVLNDSFRAILTRDRRRELSAALMEHTFAVPDLLKIPVAWGRSERSLASSMRKVIDIDLNAAGPHDLSRSPAGFAVSGNDPYIWFDLEKNRISGASAGLLRFDFKCDGQREVPRIQVFWWGDGQDGSAAERSLKFTAESGALIVPLDTSPGWLALKSVKGLRIDLDNAAACHSMALHSIALFDRRAR